MSEFWKDRSVFVTGAFGFVGANLTKALLDTGANVICLRRDDTNPNSLDGLGLTSKVTAVRGELEDLSLLSRILNEYEIDAVFHLAAQAIVGAANRSPISTFESNIRGTYMLLEACRLSPLVKRVVVASSDKAYGTSPTLPYHEDLPLQGVFPYDVSKSCTDLLARSFAKTYDLPVTVARAANIYGPGDINLSRIIPGTILSVLKGEDPIVRSDGTPVREYIHVSDVVTGYLRLLEEIDATRGEAYNIGSGDHFDVLSLVGKIIEACGASGRSKPVVMLQKKIEREIDQQYLSSEKMHQATGWRAENRLEDGLTGTIAWYRENQHRLA